MKPIVFYAVVSNEQLATFVQYARNNNVQLSLMEVGTSSEPVVMPETSITNTMIGTIADLWGKSINEIAELARQYPTVESALRQSANLPQSIVEYLEEQL